MGSKRKPIWPWLERNSVLISVFAAVLSAGLAALFAWFALVGKVDRLELTLRSIAQDTADERCQAVLVRQIAAIEKGRSDLAQVFNKLAGKHCQPLGTKSYDGEVMLATKPLSNEEIRRNLDERAKAKAIFYKEVSQFDESLGLDSEIERILSSSQVDP